MTQSIGPYLGARWEPENDDPLSGQFIPRTVPRNPTPPPVPELPYIDTALSTRALRSASVLADARSGTVQASDRAQAERSGEIQHRLDTFLAQATALYQTPFGSALVTAPFSMARDRVPQASAEQRKIVYGIAAHIGMSASEATHVLCGRGTPDQVRRMTQGLLNAGCLPTGNPNEGLADRVRRMMFQYGVGFDCAGWVAQDFLASRAIDRASSPLRSVTSMNDDLSNLSNRGFARVPIEAARPGDIVVMDPPKPAKPNDLAQPGHRAIVYAAREATHADRTFLLDLAGKALDRAVKSDKTTDIDDAKVTHAFVANLLKQPNLFAVVVDSCWGADHNAELGGVERRMWLRAEATGTWVWTDARGRLGISDTPYGHRLEGVYRPRSES